MKSQTDCVKQVFKKFDLAFPNDLFRLSRSRSVRLVLVRQVESGNSIIQAKRERILKIILLAISNYFSKFELFFKPSHHTYIQSWRHKMHGSNFKRHLIWQKNQPLESSRKTERSLDDDFQGLQIISRRLVSIPGPHLYSLIAVLTTFKVLQ